MGIASSLLNESFFIPTPSLTEANLPDQTGRVHVVTGGYTGVAFEEATVPSGGEEKQRRPKRFADPGSNSGQSKAGNVFLASEFSRRHGGGSSSPSSSPPSSILSVAFNPGNLRTELQRHMPWTRELWVRLLLYPAVYGAYTELYAGWSPGITAGKHGNGGYVIPWGRDGMAGLRNDVLAGLEGQEKGGTGVAGEFWEWCERETEEFT